MILYCKNCGDALYFNPSKGKMECFSCGNLYDVEQSQTDETTEKLSSPGGVSGASQSEGETKVHYSIFRYKGTGNYHYPATTEQRVIYSERHQELRH